MRKINYNINEFISRKYSLIFFYSLRNNSFILQVLVRQEITRKVGLSLQPEEEVLTRRFEAMHSQISAPTQFKGRISEMLSQLRMRRHIDSQNQERYTMDPIAQDDIKTVRETFVYNINFFFSPSRFFVLTIHSLNYYFSI